MVAPSASAALVSGRIAGRGRARRRSARPRTVFMLTTPYALDSAPPRWSRVHADYVGSDN
jgi:hypothetical protein